MQALSFAIHIPLVCFGIAVPAMVLFVEWLHLRTGDPLYRALARRWSKVMLALFAAGVVTGTILSFEMGLLWPGFMARFGEVFGLGFTLEGFSFFVEAIFIAIYVYGWDRLSPRLHFLCGIPVAVAGITGSLTVISVNAWMNNPQGFALRGGRGGRRRALGRAVRQPPSVARAHAHVSRRLHRRRVAGRGRLRLAWLRGERTRYVRTALVIPLTIAALAAPVQVVVGDWIARRVAEDQPLKLAAFEGLGETTEGRSPAPRRLVPRRRGALGHRDPQAAVAARPSRPRRRRCKASTPCLPTTALRSTSCGSPFSSWSRSGSGSWRSASGT